MKQRLTLDVIRKYSYSDLPQAEFELETIPWTVRLIAPTIRRQLMCSSIVDDRAEDKGSSERVALFRVVEALACLIDDEGKYLYDEETLRASVKDAYPIPTQVFQEIFIKLNVLLDRTPKSDPKKDAKKN